MQDFLYRGVLTDLRVRFSYAVTTDTANNAVLAHNCDPISAHLLCRCIGAGVLVAPLLNEDERYTLQWHYEGALKSVVVDVDSKCRTRGFVNPPNLTDLVGTEEEIYGPAGHTKVVKSNSKQVLNSGETDAGLLEVTEDLAYFFSLSDQIETAMTVMVGFRPDDIRPVSLCQGLMLQALPDCDLEQFDRLRQRLNHPQCRQLLARQPQVDNYFEHILGALQETDGGRIKYDIAAAPQPVFHCPCNREQMLQLARNLPQDELRDIRQKGEDLQISCLFCSRRYTIPADDIAALLG